MKAIDLYSGIGGWTLGLKMAGIEVISSYEWWKDANLTHNMNFGTNHKERDIRKLDLHNDLPSPSEVDFVVGSPPCTQFSFANRGGNGDLADGLIDIHKFLEVVDYLKPKYWAMENVPRVAGILKAEINGGSLSRFKHLFGEDFGTIEVYDSSEFGVPQNRKRMIAGSFPSKLFESYRERTPVRHLRDVIEALNNDEGVIDPIYQHKITKLTDHIEETPLTEEEERMNRDAKSYHPVYNKMSFPDMLDRPSRTVTALCTRVSRESIVIRGNRGFRRLTVRERGSIQSFPADYQFYSNSYGGKLKMIGNAVPPLLTYYLAQSMLEKSPEKLEHPKTQNKIVNNSNNLPKFFAPEIKGSKFSWNRSFWLAIPNLRFGSGVRFELRNLSNKETEKTHWRVNFYFGNSKNIQAYPLNQEKFSEIWSCIELLDVNLENVILDFLDFVKEVDIEGLQQNWINKERNKLGPIWLLDKLGEFSEKLIELLNNAKFVQDSLKEVVERIQLGNKKLAENPSVVISGILIGSIFNTYMEGKEIVISETV